MGKQRIGQALKKLCQNGPLTIRMSMYCGFEQVGSIGQSLPANDRQTTTQAGDIALYNSDQIVVFYGSNSSVRPVVQGLDRRNLCRQHLEQLPKRNNR